jgi:hypothetical protein
MHQYAMPDGFIVPEVLDAISLTMIAPGINIDVTPCNKSDSDVIAATKRPLWKLPGSRQPQDDVTDRVAWCVVLIGHRTASFHGSGMNYPVNALGLQ